MPVYLQAGGIRPCMVPEGGYRDRRPQTRYRIDSRASSSPDASSAQAFTEQMKMLWDIDIHPGSKLGSGRSAASCAARRMARRGRGASTQHGRRTSRCGPFLQEPGQGGAIEGQQIRSKTADIPWPPPRHMVSSAYRPWRRSNSRATVARILPPVAPAGCPSEMPEPLTLRRS